MLDLHIDDVGISVLIFVAGFCFGCIAFKMSDL